MIWQCRNFNFELNRTLVMGIVNVTPDSFSDGGQYYRPGEAVRRVHNCLEEGADLVDIGGESTRPDATPLTWQEEWQRLEPVLAQLDLAQTPVSIDTYHPETAVRACEKGVAVINCVRAATALEMVRVAQQFSCGLVLPYRPSAWGACDWPFAAFNAHPVMRLLIDPMIGFETTREEDLALLGALRMLAQTAPVLVGVSRKRLIKKLTGEKGSVGKNLGGSVGAAVWCAMAGASVVRVHDVRETVAALKVVQALANVDSVQKEVRA